MTLVTALGIHIKVADIDASRDFYERYLGLTPAFAYGDEDFLATIPDTATKAPDVYRGILYDLSPQAKLEIADGHIAVKHPAVFSEQIVSPKISAMVNVSSLVPLLESSARRPKSTVKHYHWGTVEMVLRDPDGFVVVLIAPYTEEEAAAVSRYVEVERVEAGVQ